MKVIKKYAKGGKNVLVESETSTDTQSKKRKKGEKVRTVFKEDTTVTDTDTGESTTSKTKQVDKANPRRKKSKTREVFKIRDADGKLLVKQVDRTNIFGKPKSRVRVTRRGREAGYGKGI